MKLISACAELIRIGLPTGGGRHCVDVSAENQLFFVRTTIPTADDIVAFSLYMLKLRFHRQLFAQIICKELRKSLFILRFAGDCNHLL